MKKLLFFIAIIAVGKLQAQNMRMQSFITLAEYQQIQSTESQVPSTQNFYSGTNTGTEANFGINDTKPEPGKGFGIADNNTPVNIVVQEDLVAGKKGEGFTRFKSYLNKLNFLFKRK